MGAIRLLHVIVAAAVLASAGAKKHLVVREGTPETLKALRAPGTFRPCTTKAIVPPDKAAKSGSLVIAFNVENAGDQDVKVTGFEVAMGDFKTMQIYSRVRKGFVATVLPISTDFRCSKASDSETSALPSATRVRRRGLCGRRRGLANRRNYRLSLLDRGDRRPHARHQW